MKAHGLIIALLALLSSCGKTENNKYWQANNFYSMESKGSLLLLERFRTYQQTTGVTCGPSCALMALDHIHRLGNHNEASLKALRGTEQDTTYLRHLINIFNSIGGINYLSTFDFNRTEITPALLVDFLRKGAPIIIGTNEWGGHWQVIIGYDNMGTEILRDDVLILADPYDHTDHNCDGYIIYPLENLLEGIWRNYYDPDFNWGLFVAVFPS
jgi:hypothetical protein